MHTACLNRSVGVTAGCARDRGVELMEGFVLRDNKEMIDFCKSLGFSMAPDADDPHLVRVTRDL